MKKVFSNLVLCIIFGVSSAQTPEYTELWSIRNLVFGKKNTPDATYMMLNKMDSLYNGIPYFGDLVSFMEIAIQCNQMEKAKELAFRLVRWKCWDMRIFDNPDFDTLKTMDYWPSLDSLSRIYGDKGRFDEFIDLVDKMAKEDQRVRAGLRLAQTQSERDSQWQTIHYVDSVNLSLLKELIGGYGFPTWEKLGDPYARRAWLVAQHADPEFLHWYTEQLKISVMNENGDKSCLAFMIDRDLMNRKLPQLYGTQNWGMYTQDNKLESGLWPVEDMEHLNDRREHMLLEPLDTIGVKIFDMGDIPR